MNVSILCLNTCPKLKPLGEPRPPYQGLQLYGRLICAKEILVFFPAFLVEGFQ